MKFLNSIKWFLVIIAITLTIGVVGVGCVGTVTPAQVTSSGASFDPAGHRTSSFYGFYTNQSGVVYGILGQEARDKYNSLIESYGKKIVPPINKDFGIIDNQTNFFITLPALSNFATMNRWMKSGVSK